MQFLTSLNLNKNELQNVVIQNLAAAPSNPSKGQIYFNSQDNVMYQFNGTDWKKVGAISVDETLSLDQNNQLSVLKAPKADEVEWTGVKNTPTTLVGYGISDAKIENGTITIGTVGITPLVASSAIDASKLTGAIPTDVTAVTQDLNDNSNKIATTAYVDSSISALGNIFTFKGVKETLAEINAITEANIGDVWICGSDNSEYVSTKKIEGTADPTAWEKLGVTIDLSDYLRVSTLLETTGQSTTNTMTQKAITDAINERPKLDIKSSTIPIGSRTTSVTFTGTPVEYYALSSSGERVITDVNITTGQVTFTCAKAVTEALSCYVIYY